MKRKIREESPDRPQYTEILDQDSVQTALIVGSDIFRQFGKLLLFQQGVDRQVDLYTPYMGIVDEITKFFLSRIFSISPCSEL